ncbi:MAG: tetratricopeptide repeat protein [Candidatus Eisenbacteria bacterium]|uniref:Tetratricopeptide repeat protein n=1 Tax=Eiseniibacteriota bacterium TaxID=2212470 RepID=A0A956SC39_UNCEI|nr:tetratricopeptide repeat protein [Candidatus Eisenbacteria bacterium]MCB9462594.1 tetratricopeptide repeat protein [Candidatus Eisenbacteria bacterium]
MTTGQFWLLILVLLLVLSAIGLPWLLSRRRTREPWSATAAYLETIDALVRGQKNGAVRALERVAREEPDNVGAYLRLGDLVRSMGHPAKAQKIHASLAARNLESGELRARVRESLLEDQVALENWPEVLRVGQEIRQSSKRNLIALRALAQAHRARHEWSAAFEALDEWERQAPGTARPRPHELRLEAARERLEAGQATNARSLLEEAIALGATDGEARVLLGDVYSALGEHDKAAEQWLGFARNHPDRSRTVFPRLERSYYEMGKFGDLLEVYERLVEESSDPSAAAVALADMHRRRGRPEEAIHVLQSLLANDPSRQDARRSLIQCQIQCGQTEAAVKEVEALVESWEPSGSTGLALSGRQDG